MVHQKKNRISYWLLGVFISLIVSIQPVYSGSETSDDIARILYQTTFGPTPALIETVEKQGIESWVKQQMLLPPTYHQSLYNTPFSKGDQANRENAWYQIVITSDDQLRQRMAFALSQILVVSRYGGVLSGKPAGLVNYYDVLIKHAFGNYRDLLYEIATHPVMGNYLSMMGSAKENPSTGALPDENFARELMQLFTLGLYQLNPDGSAVVNKITGKPVPTYTQDDVQELARALTGWKNSDTEFVKTMQVVSSLHDSGEKSILGTTIPAGLTGQEELSRVIDILMSHPNIAPFISKRLIQRFVTSNPSPEYVTRVSAVFNDNGKGVKGDLSAVINAILFDKEARLKPERQPEKVKEPILVLANFHRAAGFTLKGARYDDATTVMNIANQGPLRAPSVFNFYSPGYQPSSEFMQSSMVSPEYQLLNWSAYTDIANFMLNDIRNGGDTTYSLNLDELYSLLDDHAALVERINERFFAGTASAELKALMLNVLDDYQSEYVPKAKLSIVIFTALSGEEFYLQY
ncbi:DUF1800 domain-containing protein [Vibrio sp. EA2]|uniref:DUF1800 domain-containing protein n=1 Tax=Vibrio sp. EA2 TaxID=3079860 RepID=UPI00294936BC|nr:DUF1800 domain-containing protein [Vibrio sp. EA2]MDV6250116.1 DUF1800 domain-containing protein [Vibrio sp. EA2]